MGGFDPNCITYSQMGLIFNARIYYRRLTTWTRAYLRSEYVGIGTKEAQFGRLYLETLDIGHMLQLIFGRHNSEEYSQLLSQYAIIFRQLVSSQLAGNDAGVEQSLARLYENTNERAAFLESINPYWSAANYRELFNSYITHMVSTANAIFEADMAREIELYDILNAHTNLMGDMFAEGIYNYLTSAKLQGSQSETDTPCITFEEMNDIYNVMVLWFELVIWTRNFMIRRYTNTEGGDMALDKLREISTTYVLTLSKFFNNFDVDEYIQLFFNYISLIEEFVNAMIDNDLDTINRTTVELYQNADDRAIFLSSISPLWDETYLKEILYANLSSTIEESTSFLSGDYQKNIDIFTRLLDQAEMTSTMLANGLFAHITKDRPPMETS
jgi:hypothetical protein